MTSPIDSRLAPPLARIDVPGRFSSLSTTPAGPSFSQALKSAVGEVSRLQSEATAAVEQLQTGQTDDVTGVMSAVEKSELAFKTLLAIRGKLMSAYEEIRNMPI